MKRAVFAGEGDIFAFSGPIRRTMGHFGLKKATPAHVGFLKMYLVAATPCRSSAERLVTPKRNCSGRRTGTCLVQSPLSNGGTHTEAGPYRAVSEPECQGIKLP
jgi:hypothetical protein